MLGLNEERDIPGQISQFSSFRAKIKGYEEMTGALCAQGDV